MRRKGKDPKKSYRGSFNVRITPELHRSLTRLAEESGLSLNQFVQNAIEKEAEYGEEKDPQ
jgi:predicted HicB family RNase H-like nuclease